jgi:hypothetical protein
MHYCNESMPERNFLVTLMDVERNTHVIQVASPCSCDMWDFVSKLSRQELPIEPAFMSVLDMADMVDLRLAG